MNAGHPLIRHAVLSDSEALSALAYRSKKSNGYDENAMSHMRLALELTPTRLTRHRFWVAEQGAEIIGCVALAPINNKTAAVRSFYTAPEHKGRGVGRMLWLELLTIAQSQGISRLIAEADPASVTFYESLGFATDRLALSRHIPGEFVPRMSRDI